MPLSFKPWFLKPDATAADVELRATSNDVANEVTNEIISRREKYRNKLIIAVLVLVAFVQAFDATCICVSLPVRGIQIRFRFCLSTDIVLDHRESTGHQRFGKSQPWNKLSTGHDGRSTRHHRVFLCAWSEGCIRILHDCIHHRDRHLRMFQDQYDVVGREINSRRGCWWTTTTRSHDSC